MSHTVLGLQHLFMDRMDGKHKMLLSPSEPP
jgi:hypothetical protein